MKSGDPHSELEKERRLRSMKRIPLLLLLLMVALFAVTLHRPETWAAWMHAFAEAGMIGALADWFAVVALFRHPLGLPIPHTAIIPTRKDELGEAMARFIAEHFLEPEVVRRKLEGVDLSAHIVSWMKSDTGRTSLQDLSVSVMRWALGALSEERIRKFLSRLGRRQLARVSIAPFAGHTIDWLIRDGRHQEILTQMLRYTIVVLDEHRDTIRERVQKESPWWMPGFIDDRILKQLLQRIESQLFEMTLDPEHPLRAQFEEWLEGLAQRLRTSPEHRQWGEELKQQILENDSLQDYLYGLWVELATGLEKDLKRPDSRVREAVGNWLDNVAIELEQDTSVQAWINDWLTGTLVVVVEKNRQQISSLISDTVGSWDGQDTSRRVELAIGRDLQFIRINGTLVGGLVGLVIHALTG